MYVVQHIKQKLSSSQIQLSHHYAVDISRCAGIDRQLHPLKAKDPIKDKVIKIDGKNYMLG